MWGAAPMEAYVAQRRTPALFESFMRKEWLAPSLLTLVEQAKAGQQLPDCVAKNLLREEAEGIYSFDLFSEAFCTTLMGEVENYFATGLPVNRPNSMNNYGLIINDIGLRPAVTELQQAVLQHIASLLFGQTYAGQFDSHHSFMVSYRKDRDAGLDMHTDDSDVTFNVCLGKEFSGAGLTFCGMIGSPGHRHFTTQYIHSPGRAVVHLGTHRHGADDIQSGERHNLIIWNKSSQYRSSELYATRMNRYQKEGGPPDPRCLSYTHDRDASFFEALTADQRRLNRRAWCPPEHACYDGMDEVFHQDPLVEEHEK